jgi:hypothetical protein
MSIQREPVKLQAEDEREDEREPDRVRAEANEDKEHQSPVEQRARLERREQRDREGDQQEEDRAPDDERRRDGKGLADHRGHGLPLVGRVGKVAVEHDVAHEPDVLLRKGAAGVELPLPLGEAAPGDGVARVPEHKEHHEDNRGHHEKEQHSPQQPLDDEDEHRLRPSIVAQGDQCKPR